MLSLRPTCENCNKPLPNDSEDAMICTYECTYCKDCVDNVLHNVCPNCGGGFEKRPTRPAAQLKKHPASDQIVFKPVDMEAFQPLLEKMRDIAPRKR